MIHMLPDGCDEEDLVLFLVKAKKQRWQQNAELVEDGNGWKTFQFEESVFTYTDTWIGGERFAGRETVSFRNNPVWVLQYYGEKHPHLIDQETLHTFLQDALQLVDTTEPVRGPRDYRKGQLMYYHTPRGDVLKCSGREIVYLRGEEAYTLQYHGGVVRE